MTFIISSFKKKKKRHEISLFEELEFQYPCSDPSKCSEISLILPPGSFRFEAYGASGGTESTSTTLRKNNGVCDLSQEKVGLFRGNTKCNPSNSPGSGGYMSGIITLYRKTLFYLNIGGKGTYKRAPILDTPEVNNEEYRPQGGFNGGGDATGHTAGSSGGGGATDIRVKANDYWHRILVAAGGGGSDDTSHSGNSDDGSGGAGGYPNGQGFFKNGALDSSHVSTQNSGYSFGQGESAYFSSGASDLAGAGGGWFGGFTPSLSNGGAGGGSSFALSKESQIPQGNLKVLSKKGAFVDSRPYAFTKDSKYALKAIKYANGIWNGNGMFRITYLSNNNLATCNRRSNRNLSFVMMMIIISK